MDPFPLSIVISGALRQLRKPVAKTGCEFSERFFDMFTGNY